MRMSDWYVYLITTNSRTYVGSTTNVKRRLRQHNGEIVGGARSTKKFAGQWKVVAFLAGFLDRSTACRWEALVKKRARGLVPRTTAMRLVASGVCPPGRMNYPVPTGITLVIEEQ